MKQILLDLINQNITIATTKEEALSLLNKCPEYFFSAPASSTGKYHPDFALGEGGLVRHTIVAVQIAVDLLRLEQYSQLFTSKQKEAIIIALIFHDCQKQGNGVSNSTVHNHPLLASQFVQDNTSVEFSNLVAPLIEAHMGQWTTSKYSTDVLPVPQSDAQKFVHLCDYLASRKWVRNEGF